MDRKIHEEVAIASAQQLGYAELRPQWLEVVAQFHCGKDVFAVRSTWIRKESVFWVSSLCI